MLTQMTTSLYEQAGAFGLPFMSRPALSACLCLLYAPWDMAPMCVAADVPLVRLQLLHLKTPWLIVLCDCSLAGNWRAAMRVRTRMKRTIPPVQPSVHVYNALIAACAREKMWDEALNLQTHMRRDGVQANAVSVLLNCFFVLVQTSSWLS